MKKTLLSLAFIIGCFSATAQVTLIPDSNFEQALIDLNIDSDGIVNGQVLTNDISGIVNLELDGLYQTELMLIQDLTGIQDFVSLELLLINTTQITNLDVSHNTQLRYLNCNQNLLTQIDVSHNTLLEELYCGNSTDDVMPLNYISYIDLSHNPNIKVLYAANLFILSNGGVNLSNQNNNPQMTINVLTSGNGWGDPTPVCIQVDNAPLAISGGAPYSNWNMTGPYFYSGENCHLAATSISTTKPTIFPNPVQDILYFQNIKTVTAVAIYDTLGRKILEQNQPGTNISVSELASGNYIVKITSGIKTTTEKFIKQ